MSKNYDPQIESLISDLELSIASFDDRIGKLPAEPRTAAATALVEKKLFPTIDPEAHRSAASVAPSIPQAAPQAEPSPPPQESSSDLLAELEQAATQSTEKLASASENRLRNAHSLHQALHTVFEYFDRFCKHVNVLRPNPPLVYAFDAKHRFEQLQWGDSRTDFRHHTIDEKQFIASVTLRVRYTARELTINVPWRNAEAMRRELILLNFRIVNDAPILQRGDADLCLVVAGEIGMQLNFTSDLEHGRIILRTRNLQGLGLGAYALAPTAINRSLLDAIGRCVIGQSKQLPSALSPLPFNLPTAK